MISLILSILATVAFVHVILVTLILNNHTNKLRSAIIRKDWREADYLMANTPTFFYGHKDIRSQSWLEMNKKAVWND